MGTAIRVGAFVLAATTLGCGGTVVTSGDGDGGSAGGGGSSTGGSSGGSGSGGSGGATEPDAGGAGGSGGAATGGSGGGATGGSGGGMTGGSGGGVTDGGPGETCAPGFCQDLVMSSCGDPDFIPLGGMSCFGPSGNEGFCCLPACGGLGGATCSAGQYCHYPPNLGPVCGALDGIGVCQVAPVGCDDDCPGVCGCDGQFYCNACTAYQAGTDVSDSASCMVDGGAGFPAQIEGIWLIGWSGGMNHFSWVRFDLDDPYGGTAWFLAGEDLSVNLPYWPCSGQGSWTVTAKPNTLQLAFPPSCTAGFEALTFTNISPAAGFPAGAVLTANIESSVAPGAYLEGYSFPPAQCDASMTTCADPFGW